MVHELFLLGLQAYQHFSILRTAWCAGSVQDDALMVALKHAAGLAAVKGQGAAHKAARKLAERKRKRALKKALKLRRQCERAMERAVQEQERQAVSV